MRSKKSVYISFDFSEPYMVNGARCAGRSLGAERGVTIARWKSGLLPLYVFAKSVNCETQRTSPSISFTLYFHIEPVAWSSNTRIWRLYRGDPRERSTVDNEGCSTVHFARQDLEVGHGIIYAAHACQRVPSS